MASTISPILCHHEQAIENCSICRQRTHTQLITNIDTLLADARPHLLRLAHMNGIPQDVADDVVQETLLEAWRHLENLHSPERFSAWLDGICRNVCRRQARSQGTHSHHITSLSDLEMEASDEIDAAPSFDIADPQAIDPAELLNHEDLTVLLDRALGHLSPDTRELVELCYLAELPQREVAAQLGLTTGALELRLHRARKLLRQVLNGELRTEAEAFGILDAEESAGWQETRQWCWFCGKQRLRAIFEQQPDGTIDLLVRCPDCSNRYNLDIINTAGLVSMNGFQSFRPAIKHVIQIVPQVCMSAQQQRTCPICKAPNKTSIMNGTIPALGVSMPGRSWLVSSCSRCGFCVTDVISVLLYHPEAMNFVLQASRIVIEPIQYLEYEGQQTLCTGLTDLTSARRLTILADPASLQIVAICKQ